MTEAELRIMLLEMDHYRRLWGLLEDLETLLWNIKALNDDKEIMATEGH
ncbi:MAG TPA: hypothetical protein VE954_33765 [Oligoflexus sp.]|nr:hypothetical protein [Oligoflexus sp.]HYX38094.1 hypothetical protein [Oligoflexus sp.]